MENEVQKSAEELENEILEAIKNCKAIDDKLESVDDISEMVNFLVEVLGF